ncbi:hypothetical protein Pelo_2771 [Pelomyxa schiedti]|nr:hypothetical protein Pelo_2771 [Pelomyxa schiedti]
MFHGLGVRLWANGDRYVGQWSHKLIQNLEGAPIKPQLLIDEGGMLLESPLKGFTDNLMMDPSTTLPKSQNVGFVALACGIFFDRRCGPGCAVQLLRGSVHVLEMLGRRWVVCPTRHVLDLVDKSVGNGDTTRNVRCCVSLELSPTLGVVSCACWIPPMLKGIQCGIPGSSNFVVALKNEECVMNNKGRFVSILQSGIYSTEWYCNSKWLVHGSFNILTLWKIENGEPKNPEFDINLGDLYLIESGFPPGEGDVLAVMVKELLRGNYVLFVDLPHSLESGTAVFAKRVPLPYSSPIDMLWVSAEEMITIHSLQKGFKVYNTVSQRVKTFSSEYTRLVTHKPSHLVATLNNETPTKLGINQQVFCASDLDTPCNCIQDTTVDLLSPEGTGVYSTPCSCSIEGTVSFQIKDLISGAQLAIVTATWDPLGAHIEEILHNTRPSSPPFPLPLPWSDVEPAQAATCRTADTPGCTATVTAVTQTSVSSVVVNNNHNVCMECDERPPNVQFHPCSHVVVCSQVCVVCYSLLFS